MDIYSELIGGLMIVIAFVIYVIYAMIFVDPLSSDKEKVEKYNKLKENAKNNKNKVNGNLKNKKIIIDGKEVEVNKLLEQQNEYFDSLPDEAVRRYYYPKELAHNGIQKEHLSDYNKKERDKYKKEALICSVCGAPLKRVYAKCSHCGTRHLPH